MCHLPGLYLPNKTNSLREERHDQPLDKIFVERRNRPLIAGVILSAADLHAERGISHDRYNMDEGEL